MNTDAGTNGNTTPMCVFFVMAFFLLCCLMVSYKKGKIINGFVRFGESPIIDRKLNPRGYWAIFSIISLVLALVLGSAIWILFHDVL